MFGSLSLVISCSDTLGAPWRSAVLALGRSGFRWLWRLAALAHCRSGARSACIFPNPSRGAWCSIFILFFVIALLGCSHASSFLCLSLLHLVTSCPSLLGGYGALTRGVYQHLTLNGKYKKPKQNNYCFTDTVDAVCHIATMPTSSMLSLRRQCLIP